MAIEQALSKQAEKVRELKPFIDSTVATKTTFLMPFVNNVLGYDVSDPGRFGRNILSVMGNPSTSPSLMAVIFEY